MAMVMECMSGNTKIRMMDDVCNAPSQRERDTAIWERVCRNALCAIRSNPEKYEALRQKKGMDRAE